MTDTVLLAGIVGSTELYVTGELPIRVKSPQRIREFGEMVAGGNVDAARSMLARAEMTFDQCKSPLPDEPDERVVEDWLLRVRREMWTEG